MIFKKRFSESIPRDVNLRGLKLTYLQSLLQIIYSCHPPCACVLCILNYGWGCSKCWLHGESQCLTPFCVLFRCVSRRDIHHDIAPRIFSGILLSSATAHCWRSFILMSTFPFPLRGPLRFRRSRPRHYLTDLCWKIREGAFRQTRTGANAEVGHFTTTPIFLPI